MVTSDLVGGFSAHNSSIPNPLESQRRLRDIGFVVADADAGDRSDAAVILGLKRFAR